MAGDRGMITSARIKALQEIPGMAWLTCLRAPAIKKLADDGGPLQMSLPDTQDLAEISHPDYPGERLIACHNPALAEERKPTGSGSWPPLKPSSKRSGAGWRRGGRPTPSRSGSGPGR